MERSPHILVVDDDREICSLVSQFLSRHQLRVSTARDGAEMMKTMEAARIDLVVLDVMLPGEDGLSLCRKLRADSATPVIMLTAMGEDIDRIVGLEMGADDYLPKPFNPRELLARLKAILRRRRDPAAGALSVLRFGRLEIDEGSRCVRIDGEARSVTSYQFDLLLTLARNAGRVMSRERLMDLTKGADLEAFDRSIDVHISRLRAALEDAPAHPRRIITVRGAGYVFARAQDQD